MRARARTEPGPRVNRDCGPAPSRPGLPRSHCCANDGRRPSGYLDCIRVRCADGWTHVYIQCDSVRAQLLLPDQDGVDSAGRHEYDFISPVFESWCGWLADAGVDSATRAVRWRVVAVSVDSYSCVRPMDRLHAQRADLEGLRMQGSIRESTWMVGVATAIAMSAAAAAFGAGDPEINLPPQPAQWAALAQLPDWSG